MWFNLAGAVRHLASLGRMPGLDEAKLPVLIASDEDYLGALGRIVELEARRGDRRIETELAVLAEAMLRWEMRQDDLDELAH